MEPTTALALGSVAGNIAGGLFGKSGQESANAANLAIARENRAFQERMSSTAYQRSMADMKKAGLNPMLAYMKGGASTPTGATATMQNPNASMATAMMKLVPDLVQTINTQAQTSATQAATGLTHAKTDVVTPAATAGAKLSESASIVADAINTGVNSIRDFAEYLGVSTAKGVQGAAKIWREGKQEISQLKGYSDLEKSKSTGSRDKNDPLRVIIRY